MKEVMFKKTLEEEMDIDKQRKRGVSMLGVKCHRLGQRMRTEEAWVSRNRGRVYNESKWDCELESG